MESLSKLKKCFEFVSELSKKILGTVPPKLLPQNPPITTQKSLSEQSKPQLQIKPILTTVHQQKLCQTKPVDKPKVISFESYMQTKPNTLKPANIKFSSHLKYSYTKQNSPHRFKQQTCQIVIENRDQQRKKVSESVENTAKNQSNQNCPLPKIIPSNKINQKHLQTNIQNKKQKNQSQNSSQSQQEIFVTKKNKKQIKKKQKNLSLQQSLQIDTNQIIFTYQDGDDISSIAAKSQTTDQIQPQLLSFITKKGNLYFNKLDQQKYYDLPVFDMKKKPANQQAETVEIKNLKGKQSETLKKRQREMKVKKRAFQLYPGETFEQFKKRILIGCSGEQSSSQEGQENIFEQKVIRKEEYDKLLSHLNSSMSRMEEEKNRQGSILVVQKMVEQQISDHKSIFAPPLDGQGLQILQSQQQKNTSQPKQVLHPSQRYEQFFLASYPSDESQYSQLSNKNPLLLKNYKLLNNPTDNPSFKLYFSNP